TAAPAHVHPFRPPQPAAAQPEAEPEDLSFELDLSNLDRLVEPGSPPRDAPVPEPSVADASAMFDRFDDARSDAMQTTLTNDQFDRLPAGEVDLDLGNAANASATIH